MDPLSSAVYDLGQPLFPGMPHFPTHPPFLFCVTKLHGELVLPSGASSSADTFTLGGYVGTRIDALSHFLCDGRLHGGYVPTQTYAEGIREHSVDTIAPILRP